MVHGRGDPFSNTLSRPPARWQLAAGEGACDEGLADLERTWTTQATLERRPGYLLVQARNQCSCCVSWQWAQLVISRLWCDERCVPLRLLLVADALSRQS